MRCKEVVCEEGSDVLDRLAGPKCAFESSERERVYMCVYSRYVYLLTQHAPHETTVYESPLLVSSCLELTSHPNRPVTRTTNAEGKFLNTPLQPDRFANVDRSVFGVRWYFSA